MQVLYVHQQMNLCGHSHLLIELYHEEPIHLFKQFENAHDLQKWSFGDGIHSIPDNTDLDWFPNCLTSTLKLPQFLLFLESLLPIEHGMETTFQRLIIETAGLVQQRIDKSDPFEMYINSAEDLSSGSGGRTPFLTGLCFIFFTHFGEFQKNVIEYIKSKPPRYDNLPFTAVSQGNIGSQFDEKNIQLAFAPSGSGKTTTIFHELTRHYGYYMVSCALPKYKDIHAEGSNTSSEDFSETLFDPKVLQGVSEDTRELYTMFNYIKSLNLAFSIEDYNLLEVLEIGGVASSRHGIEFSTGSVRRWPRTQIQPCGCLSSSIAANGILSYKPSG